MFGKRITSFAFAIRYLQGRNFRGSSTKSPNLNSHKIWKYLPKLFLLFMSRKSIFSISTVLNLIENIGNCFFLEFQFRKIRFLIDLVIGTMNWLYNYSYRVHNLIIRILFLVSFYYFESGHFYSPYSVHWCGQHFKTLYSFIIRNTLRKKVSSFVVSRVVYGTTSKVKH